MKYRIFTILSIVLSLAFMRAKGSHIVGGEVFYKYLGDTTVFGTRYNKYQINLSIYEDCFNGQPNAIIEDNPAYFSLYDGTGQIIDIDTNVVSMPQVSVPANFSNACVSNIPQTCLFKRTFNKTYYLLPNATGYLVSYQRCCRNSQILNISDPGNHGSTYYCTIPPAPYINNSAVFKNYPPQIICLNEPLYYDNSATDPDDGDSLSYEFCYALYGASNSDIKPIPLAPPYDTVIYVSQFTFDHPMTGHPAIHIDPVTGIITGTPNMEGRYLVTICCNEWRKGVIINTIKREFQFVVTNCSKKVIANMPQYSTDPNTYIVSCTDFTVNFDNTSTGGFAYHWDFGLRDSPFDTSSLERPTFTYPDTGTFAVKLVVNPSSTCPDSITRLAKIYPKFHAAFDDTGGHCIHQPIAFIDQSSATIKPVTNWHWNFGDGDSSLLQNPTHNYQYGGTYNVVLVSQNIKDCIDTVFRKVIVQAFTPFAGKDTSIVKGESIHFNASGGTQYTWSPATNLNDTTIYNPTGYYPDTGTYTYTVFVTSNFGCAGYDTIHVSVINQAEFFMPNAFSPNGDGRNDQFRPIAVGYRGLKYFRVFNRWGQDVYYSTSLETGWNGTFNNVQCEMGVYFWEISFIDRFGKEAFLKGDVTLVR